MVVQKTSEKLAREKKKTCFSHVNSVHSSTIIGNCFQLGRLFRVEFTVMRVVYLFGSITEFDYRKYKHQVWRQTSFRLTKWKIIANCLMSNCKLLRCLFNHYIYVLGIKSTIFCDLLDTWTGLIHNLQLLLWKLDE